VPRRKRNFAVPAGHQTGPDPASRIRTLRGTPEWELWNECLTEHQRREARRTGLVPVLGSNGGQYLVGVDPSWGSAVTQLDRRWAERGRTRHRCFNVSRCSDFDAAISKILLIQADEELFDRTAGG
jgi:hypothetical protein